MRVSGRCYPVLVAIDDAEACTLALVPAPRCISPGRASISRYSYLIHLLLLSSSLPLVSPLYSTPTYSLQTGEGPSHNGVLFNTKGNRHQSRALASSVGTRQSCTYQLFGGSLEWNPVLIRHQMSARPDCPAKQTGWEPSNVGTNYLPIFSACEVNQDQAVERTRVLLAMSPEPSRGLKCHSRRDPRCCLRDGLVMDGWTL